MMEQDLTPIVQRLDTILARVESLTEQQRKQQELIAELTPIAKVALATGIEKLDALDKQGYFEFGKELIEIGKKIVEGFSPGDVHQLGDAIVQILEAVKAMTQPSVLAAAADAVSVVDNAADVKPLGIFGMVKATKNDDVQKGMAIMLEVLRRVGHGANVAAGQRALLEDKKSKLANILGSRKHKKILGTERKALPAPAARPAAPPAAVVSPSGASCAPGKPQPTAAVIDGIAYTADGHLADASQWSRSLGEALAEMQGVAMTQAHWAIVDAARSDHAATGSAPNIRRLTQIASVTTKDIYTLFPKAPGRTIAKIAGLPKPAGCL